MTKEDILKEPDGRRLDSWIAEHIFGHHRKRRAMLFNFTDEEANQPSHLDYCWEWFDRDGKSVKCEHFSTEYNSAWLIAEKLSEEEYVKVVVGVSHYHGHHCYVTAPDKSQMWPLSIVRQDAFVMAETMPLALCRAALISALTGE